MDYKKVLRYIDEFVESVDLLGGEPLLYPEIEGVLRDLQKAGKKVSIITNGQINIRDIKKICTYNIQQILVSIDGLQTINDFIRGDGSFKKAVEFIEEFIALKEERNFPVKIGVNLVISKLNYKEITCVLDFLKSLQIDIVQVNYLSMEGNAQDNYSILYLDEKELLETYEIITRYKIKNPILDINLQATYPIIFDYLNRKYGSNYKVAENKCSPLTKSDRWLYNQITAVNQEIFIFDDTLKNNITLYKNYSDSRVTEVLKQMELDTLLNRLPKGIESEMKENGNVLSGGERQRIGLARAILKNTPFIILDESTSNLDNETAYAIEKKLIQLEDKCCIFIMHRLNAKILDQMDEIIVLKEGQIKEKGNFQELLNEGAWFTKLYKV